MRFWFSVMEAMGVAGVVGLSKEMPAAEERPSHTRM